ncbi:hypothetical protein [Methanobacterium petrolearium]|uniref:hypothetical protein n=1 Tax=Methanobacterium petrolearium TaxID=710190 RepID=UPI001AE1E369|nr:hypothetical protein [Methanobacterium petrolearium]MBP1945875.1 hypothetical protein [Methanobacterium petrolearium]BDZ69573.1 hypothetical protein GCM10025861_00900 [Methanobacterium petrolearium]
MKNSNILKMGLIGTIILIVLSSGCTSSSTNQPKTFSDGVSSFNYPADFDNVTYSSENNTNFSSSMQAIAKLENTVPLSVHSIYVAKNTSSISPKEIRDRLVSNVKNMSTGEILASATETNSNSVVVKKIIYTDEYAFCMREVHVNMHFKINDTVYVISVFGPDSNKQQIMDTANIIFQSITAM